MKAEAIANGRYDPPKARDSVRRMRDGLMCLGVCPPIFFMEPNMHGVSPSSLPVITRHFRR